MWVFILQPNIIHLKFYFSNSVLNKEIIDSQIEFKQTEKQTQENLNKAIKNFLEKERIENELKNEIKKLNEKFKKIIIIVLKNDVLGLTNNQIYLIN